MKRCAKSLMIVSLNACRIGDCVDKVNGYTCDCDEDHELMLQLNGSTCVARNVKHFLLQRVQIAGVRCDTVQAKSAEIHSSFDRGRVFVAACSIWSHAHTRIQLSAVQQQCSTQRVGALLIHRPAWVDQHTGGSRLTPTVHRCPEGMAVGGPCDQTAQQYSAETLQTVGAVFFVGLFPFVPFFLKKNFAWTFHKVLFLNCSFFFLCRSAAKANLCKRTCWKTIFFFSFVSVLSRSLPPCLGPFFFFASFSLFFLGFFCVPRARALRCLSIFLYIFLVAWVGCGLGVIWWHSVPGQRRI